MNFYKHHIGDYSQATAHLTFTEDAAYSRLLRKYYADEHPISGPIKAAQRLVGARTREEREAVETVLDEFFEWDEATNVWRNKRADEEIAQFREQAAGDDERRANEAERQTRHRARRKELFALLREHGQVPPYSTTTKELERILSRVTGQQSNATVTDVSRVTGVVRTPSATANQNPESRSQSAIGTFEASTQGLEGARDPAEPDPAAMPVGQNPAVRACTLMRQAGIPAARMNPSHAEFLAGIREGATPEQYRDAVTEAISAGKSNPFAWVIATVRKRNADAQRSPTPGASHARSREPRKSLADQTLEWAAGQQALGVPLDPDDRPLRPPLDIAVR
jgi:uncharacterized protein YdaU (DUF1376 family)